jgi:AcrR family transcriptional regulator
MPAPPTGRPRDAAASKAALFGAAQVLFGQKGFERTTVREIGEQAGVDAALIARYFGSKADLYVAVMAAERMDGGAAGASGPPERPYEGMADMADAVVTRTDLHGPGPIMQALIRSDTTEEIREAAKSRLARRLVTPVAESLAGQGTDRAQLRAEIAVSALFGVSLGRSLGWFEQLQSVPKDELVALITEALGDIAGEGR